MKKETRTRNELLPVNLQLFAEEGGEVPTGVEAPNPESGPEPKDNDGPTAEELLADMAKERAEKEKTKLALDKALKEVGELKKSLKAKQTADEQIESAKAEAEAARKEADEAKDARISELEAKIQIIEYTKQCMNKEIGMEEKIAKEFAVAISSGEVESAFGILGKHIKAVRAEERNNALAEYPEIKAGSGGANDKKSVAAELAKRSAQRTMAVNEDNLKKFMLGGN